MGQVLLPNATHISNRTAQLTQGSPSNVHLSQPRVKPQFSDFSAEWIPDARQSGRYPRLSRLQRLSLSAPMGLSLGSHRRKLLLWADASLHARIEPKSLLPIAPELKRPRKRARRLNA